MQIVSQSTGKNYSDCDLLSQNLKDIASKDDDDRKEMKCILCGMNFEDSARAVHDHFVDHHEDVQTGMVEYLIAYTYPYFQIHVIFLQVP